MPTQIITIDKNGGLFGLDHKKKGLDLAKLGKAMKQRVSDIQWDEDLQHWHIRFLVGRFAQQIVTTGIAWLSCIAPAQLADISVVDDDLTLHFHDYDDAVKAEVMILQGLQIQGIFTDAIFHHAPASI